MTVLKGNGKGGKALNEVMGQMKRMVTYLQGNQSSDGSWRYCFENGIMTDAYMIILLRTLKIHDERLLQQLTQRILERQGQNGAWRWFADEDDGNLSATIEAYYALLFSGVRTKEDPQMKTAEKFIQSKGGLDRAGMLTKVMLALTGNYSWPEVPFVPVEFILIPSTFPIHFFDIVGYTRVHIAPIMLAWDRRFSLKTRYTPDLSDIRLFEETSPISARIGMARSPQYRSLLTSIKKGIQNLPFAPQQLHEAALQRLETFMRERIEPDGLLYSYFSATFFMIFGLLARGYSTRHPVILEAIKGMRGLLCKPNGLIHIQNSTSTIWDTALLSHALQDAGVLPDDPSIQKAGQYLLSKQQDKFGDWKVHNPFTEPGGWGFSDINTINPDVDDTTAALRAIKRLAKGDPKYHQAWKKGVKWVLSMQNEDGGWSAFEKNVDKEIFRLLTFEDFDSVSTDPSSADLTGRTLEFLGRHAGYTVRDQNVRKGVEWLLRHQQKNGSWYGRWGICYIYGTWASLTGLSAVRVKSSHARVQRAMQWLISIQNQDGGWGESCHSDKAKSYVPLGASTLSQTAWAVDALISVSKSPTPAIEQGIQYLLRSLDHDDWTTTYPTGAGIPGGFYIHYHSYRYIWPLLALSHYHRKYSS